MTSPLRKVVSKTRADLTFEPDPMRFRFVFRRVRVETATLDLRRSSLLLKGGVTLWLTVIGTGFLQILGS